MQTVNSLSGGKTSSYLAAHYPADYNVFSLVRTSDKRCMFPDAKLRQEVSDRIGCEFIGTLEDDMIIYTMFDLEQYIGQKIHWVTGKTFDEVIMRGKKKYLPNVTQRFCTTEMKLRAIFNWWIENFDNPIEVRIGYRANEQNRAVDMISKVNVEGLCEFDAIVGFHKNGNKKHQMIGWEKPVFPLIEDSIFKDNIIEFWKGKPVRFAKFNNCVGCPNRNEMLLKLMSIEHPNKFEWFEDQEKDTGDNVRTWKNGITYQRIRKQELSFALSFDDFDECDSGHCGL
jgi:hypothetical protein